MASTTFETASAADLNVIRALLSASELPIDDVGAHIAHFVLARREGATIGTVAVEYAGDVALLRSLCVTQSHRGEAVGVRLLAAIEAQAASRGVRELYLLTTSAAAFFEHHGFSRASREEAPEAIRSTAQFRTLCSSAAVCMRKTLPSSSTEQSGEP
ncbi:MAG TPA: arsenic resistance N-acetyltransferase ArsN2 [Polyangiaceae bacterium]|nr:arsenic resistance N-acetyltransferase ArsN2 [Polyangiaceae bacterium]